MSTDLPSGFNFDSAPEPVHNPFATEPQTLLKQTSEQQRDSQDSPGGSASVNKDPIPESNTFARTGFLAAAVGLLLNMLSNRIAEGFGPVVSGIGLILYLVGFVLSILALSQIKKTGQKGRVLAIITLVFCSFLFLLILIQLIGGSL